MQNVTTVPIDINFILFGKWWENNLGKLNLSKFEIILFHVVLCQGVLGSTFDSTHLTAVAQNVLELTCISSKADKYCRNNYSQDKSICTLTWFFGVSAWLHHTSKLLTRKLWLFGTQNGLGSVGIWKHPSLLLKNA